MNIARRIVAWTAFFLAFAFIAVGYAALTDNMSIDGIANISPPPPPPKGIFIISVEEVAKKNVEDKGTTYVSPTNIKLNVNASSGGSITYKVTVENNTGATYWFRGISAPALDGYSNGLVGSGTGVTITTKDKLSDTKATFDTSDWVPPNTVREFYVVYSFGNRATGNISTLVNFEFGGKVASYGDEILAILNDPDKYGLLSSAFDNVYAKYGTDVLSNTGADAALFQSLFDTELKLDGKDVTITIQRKNVDNKATGDAFSPSGPSGCEYTVYITTDDPTTGKPTVQAVSYTTTSDGTWRQIGELYEGTVSTGTYTDSEGKRYTSLNVNTWIANEKTYTIFSYNGQKVEYIVGATQNGDQFDKYKTIAELMGGHDQDLYNMLNRAPIIKAADEILDRNVNSEAPEIVLLREAFDKVIIYYVERNKGDFEMISSDKWTRAEVISAFEALGEAMEYYQQFHS